MEQLLFDDYEAARVAIQSERIRDSFFPDFDRFSETREHFFADVALMAWPGRTEEQAKREVMEKLERGWHD